MSKGAPPLERTIKTKDTMKKPKKDTSRIYQIWAHLGEGESLLLRETRYYSVALMLKDFYIDMITYMEGSCIEIRTIE